eukprot:Trichotokara_eunicae@DN6690_c0_g1_i1.p1
MIYDSSGYKMIYEKSPFIIEEEGNEFVGSSSEIVLMKTHEAAAVVSRKALRESPRHSHSHSTQSSPRRRLGDGMMEEADTSSYCLCDLTSWDDETQMTFYGRPHRFVDELTAGVLRIVSFGVSLS